LPSLGASTQVRSLGAGRDQGVFEVVEDHRTDTYQAVYAVKFDAAVYVLHAFQKKSPSGIKTARKDFELIGRRLNEARADYEVRFAQRKNKPEVERRVQPGAARIWQAKFHQNCHRHSAVGCPPARLARSPLSLELSLKSDRM
jgi:hypothetical protein